MLKQKRTEHTDPVTQIKDVEVKHPPKKRGRKMGGVIGLVALLVGIIVIGRFIFKRTMKRHAATVAPE